MKKTIYTLNIDDYSPEITDLTYPLIKRWANKIQADFYVIDRRVFPKHYAPVYEKLQIYDLQYERGDDWSIFIDSDALVHTDMWDPTEFLHKDTVAHNGCDMAANRWRYDKYFRRDGRHIGSCNWFTVASDWCRDLWRPLEDITYEEALENIFPLQDELRTVITRDHLIDDYTLSRNIAKFGLHFTTIIKMMQDMGDVGNYFWHQYTIDVPTKVTEMKQVLQNWGVSAK
jgi:hypothetical protein